MIAALDDVVGRALEGGNAVVENRTAAEAELVRHALELVDGGSGEVLAMAVLVRPQHIHGEVARRAKALKRGRMLLEAPEHERRIEGNGRKGIGREAFQPAGRRAGRDNRDAGRKSSQSLTEMAGVHDHAGTGLLGHEIRASYAGQIQAGLWEGVLLTRQ
jgi:hypothetical protein